MSSRRLDPGQIVATLERLERRIGERFEGRGIARVCADLTALAREARGRAEALSRPNLPIRLASAAIALAGLGLLVALGAAAQVAGPAETGLFPVVQTLDAALSLAVLVGGALYFLATLEARWKRAQALDTLHELRSVIHVIDMQQLTKDPSAILSGGPRTKSSPERRMSPFELTRYLDYCSEMLSLAAKIAALYAERSRDDLVIGAASDLGHTAADLNLKIWQKIALVERDLAGDRGGRG